MTVIEQILLTCVVVFAISVAWKMGQALWGVVAAYWSNQAGTKVDPDNHLFVEGDIRTGKQLIKHWQDGGSIEIGRRSIKREPDSILIGKCMCECGQDVYWKGYGRKPKFVNTLHKEYHYGKRSHYA